MKYTLSEAHKQIVEVYGLRLSPESLRFRLKEFGLLKKENDFYHQFITEEDLKMFVEKISDPFILGNIANSLDVPYGKIYYFCLKAQIPLKKEFGRLRIENMEDVQHVRNHFRTS